MWARARVWADRYFLRKYIGRRHGGWVSSRGSCLKRGESKRGGVNSELRIRCFIINSTDYGFARALFKCGNVGGDEMEGGKGIRSVSRKR